MIRYEVYFRVNPKIMLINEVAQVTRLAISTIRYYEREGLLDERHITRQPNGYRTYTKGATERLQHFRQARLAGLTISEIRRLSEAFDGGKLTNVERRAFLEGKIDSLSKKIIVLQEMRAGFEAELADIQP